MMALSEFSNVVAYSCIIQNVPGVQAPGQEWPC